MERNLSSGKYIDPISHDGVHDSLTHLASPNFFYEILFRESARSEREGSPLTLISFQLSERDPNGTSSEYEIALINFAKLITSQSRGSDITARISRFEFFSLLALSHQDALGFIERINEGYRDQKFQSRGRSVTRLTGERPLALLNRLDLLLAR